MPFEVIRDDITRVKADAIVNTANPNPVVGAGTDAAIHRAAGPELLSAREAIGPIPVGSSVETPAFDLPAKYVLHTVSPAWKGGLYGEEALLKSAYDAALNLADRLHCRSIAFPLLSAGSYGFPEEIALSVAVRAFTDFLLTHDMQIYLVVFGPDAFLLARGLFGDLKAYIDDNYVGKAEAEEYADELLDYGRRRRMQAAPMQSIRRKNARAAEAKPETPFYAGLDSFCADQAAPNDLESFLKQKESTFTEHLLDLLKEHDEKDSDVYRRAEISRQLFHKIVNRKDYQPTKSTAIQLALGLRLNLAETQKLLGKAGYSLTRSSKADLVVQYFIERGEYSIVVINTALFDCGLPLLKTGGAV